MKQAKKLIVFAMCLFMVLALIPTKVAKAADHDTFATAEPIELNTYVTGTQDLDLDRFYTFTTPSDPYLSYSVELECLNISQIKWWGKLGGLGENPLYIYDSQYKLVKYSDQVSSRYPADVKALNLSPNSTYYVEIDTSSPRVGEKHTVNFRFKIIAETEKQAMYRLYNRSTGEHFYTANDTERDKLTASGWKYEGIGWYAPQTSSTPVYRMYNPGSGDHHYTTNVNERDMLVKAGWKYEGIGWYSDDNKAVPLYREFNPRAKTGAHNYTSNPSEHKLLVSNGWRDEGIGWYGVNAN